MAFNSLIYLGFLAVVAATFWVLHGSARRVLIFLASVVFYASCNVMFVWLPVVVAAVVFVCGRAILSDAQSAKKWVWVGASSLLALLAVFKYRGFVLDNLAPLVGIPAGPSGRWSVTSLAFPVGISFYTFEAIAYLVDVRQGRVKMPSFVDLCLFFFFWPNILSGPIVRARELMPQLDFTKKFEPRFAFEGVDRIVWGLVQKNVIANVLGMGVDRGLGSPGASISTLDSWFVAIACGLQIYFDFAGYTNLAIGTARLIGVTLPENFRQPYHAANPADFWNRWHMTLSRWIRDYLFFPINARWKSAPLPMYLSLVAVMAFVGLWHGAAWGFLLWGTMHGMYLAAYRAYDGFAADRPGLKASRFAAVFWRMTTLAAVAAAWVPFRADSLTKVASLWTAMFARLAWRADYNVLFYAFTLMVMLFCAVEPLLMGVLREWEEQTGESGPSMFRIVFRPVAYLCGLALFLLFDQGYNQFIYSQF